MLSLFRSTGFIVAVEIFIVECFKSGSGHSDHAGMQGFQFWSLAMWRVWWHREVSIVKRKLKNVSQVKFDVMA
jgi:hypothetical protein